MARVIVEALGYVPLDHLHKIKCPVFLRAATQDHLCPPEVIKAATERLGGAGEIVIHERNMTHLGAHQIGKTPAEIAPVIAFLKRHLMPEMQQGQQGHQAPSEQGDSAQTQVLDDGVDEDVM